MIPPILPEHRVWCPLPPRSHHYAHNGIHQWLGMMVLNGDFMVIVWWLYGDIMVILWDFKAWFMMDIVIIIGISWGIWPNYILVAQARGDELTAITMVMICTSIRWGAASRTRSVSSEARNCDQLRMFHLPILPIWSRRVSPTDQKYRTSSSPALAPWWVSWYVCSVCYPLVN